MRLTIAWTEVRLPCSSLPADRQPCKDTSMPISFQCPECDKSFRVPDEKRGKRIKCSGCSVVVTVPDDDEEIEDDLKPARRSKNSGKSKGKRSKGKSSGGSPGMWIGIAGGGVVVIGLVIWLMMPSKPAAGPGNTTPGQSGSSSADGQPVDRTQDRNRLKTLTLAMHNHHNLHLQLPVADRPENFGPDGRTWLSWRVHVLPFLSKDDLYKKFHLNEPWDSPHNKTLIDQMPDEYRSGSEQGTNTRMQTLTGPNALFFQRKVRFRDITDGMSNTLMLVQVGLDKAVPWTKPDDVVFDPANPLVGFGNVGQSFLCATSDGMVREISSTIDAKSLAAAASARGGEIINLSNFSVEQPRPAAATTPMPNADPLKGQMQQIGLAMHNHHDQYRRFPVADVAQYFDAQGRPNLSWRVHLLPLLGQAALYQEFHMNEPWNSPHNSQLINKMPAVYQNASRQGSKTPFVVFTGAQTPFSQKLGPSISSFIDGSSNTILAVAVADDKMVTWTEPVDISFDPNSPLAGVGTIPPLGLPVLMTDGSFARVKPTVPPDMFKSLVTPSGGEIVDLSSILTK